ncbi:hypothetical protein MASR1M6_08690 [Rubrivivax sp.]|jgi:hypothetical protein
MGSDESGSARAVLEELMERALSEARLARRSGNIERLRALVEILSWGKLQAEVAGLGRFANREVDAIDPESLLLPERRAA